MYFGKHKKGAKRFRKGVSTVEFAVTLPVLVVLVFGSIEASHTIQLKQGLTITAYEAVMQATTQSCNEAQARSRARPLRMPLRSTISRSGFHLLSLRIYRPYHRYRHGLGPSSRIGLGPISFSTRACLLLEPVWFGCKEHHENSISNTKQPEASTQSNGSHAPLPGDLHGLHRWHDGLFGGRLVHAHPSR